MDQKKYQNDYKRVNLKQIKLALNRQTEQEIIDQLEKQPNIRQYIIGLIKADMKKGQE